MGAVHGTYLYNNVATNGGTAKLWTKNATWFPAWPAQDDALPGGGQVGGSVTTGVAYGGAGAYAWDSIADGEYFVSVEYSGTITYLYHPVYTNIFIKDVEVIFYNNGSVLTTGVKADRHISYGATIQQVTLLADQSGSIVIDIWKDVYANYPPTVADTITASAKPTLSTATKSQDATLTGWTTAIAAGDTLRFNIDSVATVTRVVLSLKVLMS